MSAPRAQPEPFDQEQGNTPARHHLSPGHESLILRLRIKTSLDDIKSPYFWRAVVAELIGTLILVFVGCASTLAPTTTVTIALTFGLSVATMVWAIAHVSGGHINPAVTLAMLVTRHVSLARGLFYLIAQILGSISGAAILAALTPLPPGGTGVTQPGNNVSPEMAFGIELIITFVLVFTVFASCDSKRDDLNGSGPLAIGLSVTLCHLPFIQFTGASMNPARSFGPALVYKKLAHHWVYWVGPCLGGVLAGLMYEHVFSANTSLKRARAYLLSSRYDGGEYETVAGRDKIVKASSDIGNMEDEGQEMTIKVRSTDPEHEYLMQKNSKDDL